MAEQPTNKQQALMQFAIGEVGAVLDRAEQINNASKDLLDMMSTVRKEIDDDLTRLGNMVETIATSKDGYRKEANLFSKHIEAKVDEIKLAFQTARPVQAKKRGLLIPCLASIILTACAICGGAYYYYSIKLHNPLAIGFKIEKEWPNMDKQTQDKINKLLTK